jgi:hypothetical protein
VVFPSVILAYEQQVIELMAAMSAARSFAAWLQSYFNVLLECLGHLYSIVLHINKKTIKSIFNVFEQSPLSPTLGGERSSVTPFARPDQGIAVCW